MEATKSDNPSGHEEGNECQYLTFIMAEEEYGVDILTVQEIRGWESATKIPNAPEFIKGVINLRGTIVPIMDLRLRFGLEEVAYSPTTVVIILKVNSDSKERVVGIVVDAVSDVYTVADTDIRKPPELNDDDDGSIRGLVSVNDRTVILMNVDTLLSMGATLNLNLAAMAKDSPKEGEL